MKKEVFAQAEWICPAKYQELKPIDPNAGGKEPPQLPEELKDLRMRMKKSIRIGTFQKAVLRITADDYYKLYLNGTLAGQGPAQGYYFDYQWNEYDVTEMLREGENTILCDVYYQGLYNRAFNSADRRLGMAAELTVDGVCVLATGPDWECSEGPRYEKKRTIGYDTLFLEDVDSRKQWGPWEPCAVKKTDYTFSDTPAKPLALSLREPVSSEPLPAGGTFYDFGEEITASLLLRAKGSSGSRIRILCGEETGENPEKVRFDMRCNCRCEEFWTLGEGESCYEQYDYKGFRYLALIPEGDAELTLTSVQARVRHYPFDDNYCTLKTDSEVLRDVWRICKNGVKYGSQEVYVDCPTREKGQYSGDMTITSASQIILTGDVSLLKKGIDAQMDSQKICDGLLAVTPGSFHQEIADYSLQFPIYALRYYRRTGDRDYLKKNLSICEDILRYFKQYAREDGLLDGVSGKWNVMDWPANLRDNYDFPLTEVVEQGCHNVINAFYLGCVKLTEEMREILEIPQEKESPALTEAFQKEFFCPETGLFTDTGTSSHSALHSNAVAAYYGLYPSGAEQGIGDFLMKKEFSCGVYMAYFVLMALCRMGRFRDAYSLIVSEGEHSWYNMVREGASTCFEAWGKDQKWNTSLCHPWASAPISVLAEEILPNLPELGTIIIQDTK